MDHYVTTGKNRSFNVHETPGDSGTIIAVHGLTGHHQQLMHYQTAFSGEYRFISYDVSGRGNSDPALPDTSIDTHAEELADLIDALKIENPILLGYSMGAYICVLATANYSFINPKALILLDGGGKADDTARELVLPSLDRMKKKYVSEKHYIEDMHELYTRLNIEWNAEVERSIRYELTKESAHWKHKSNAELIAQDFESFYSFKPGEMAERIVCPVFLLIATGNLGGQRALFTEDSYTTLKKVLHPLRLEYTKQNHYEIILNNQPEIFKQIRDFLFTEVNSHENQ